MMLQQLFGTQLAFPIRVAIAAIVIAALLGLTVLVMRRLAGRAAGGDRRGRTGPRLSVLDSVSVDQRRRLVLVRRDEVEHLLLIGGNSDLVIEQNIGATEAAETAPAAVPPPREAPTLQRPMPRRPLSAAPAPAVLTAEAAAPGLPAPEPAPSDAAAAPATETREERRSVLARRPLMRGDGTLSGRPASRTAATPEPAPAKEPVRAEAPRPDQARLDALKAEFAASTPTIDAPKVDAPKIDAPKVEAARVESVKVEAPRPEVAKAEPPKAEPEDAPPAVSEVAAELEDLTHRLDAALVHPQPAAAAPQISLSDLLGDEPAAPAEPAPAPRPEPVIEPPPPPRSEGPLSRFLSQSRNRSAEARPVEPRAIEPRPRVDAPPRTEAPRTEAPPRPREFAFRPAGENRPLPAPEQARRDPLALRDVSREAPPLRPETTSPLLRAPSPSVAPASPEVAPPVIHAPAPSHAAPPVGAPPSAPHAGEAPAVEPDAQRDPLDDFDAEMANLLGRTNARSR
ncbi:Meckel syndrome type 1 protein [Xanthobacter sp. SG618]|nr:Meckel syndrome type 1 protein [Xanthobacter sp. SG618]